MSPARQFLALTLERRALAFGQAATQRAVDPVILEKDFWVCWLLGVLFAEPRLAPYLVFKGGTSLSEVAAAAVHPDPRTACFYARLGAASKN